MKIELAVSSTANPNSSLRFRIILLANAFPAKCGDRLGASDVFAMSLPI